MVPGWFSLWLLAVIVAGVVCCCCRSYMLPAQCSLECSGVAAVGCLSE